MKIVMIGKNDTWGVMLAWKKALKDNIKYFMAHPAGGYVDDSEYNINLIESLEEADIIFLCVSIRHPDRGYPDIMRLHNINFENYKNKIIVYYCGDNEAKYNLKSFTDIYNKYNYSVALTPDIATILNIPFLPIPIDLPKIKNKYKYIVKIPIEARMITRIHGQWEKTLDDINDFESLGGYIKAKYNNEFLLNAVACSFYSSVEKLFTANAHIRIHYDNKNGCYSNLGLLTPSIQIATISSLKYEYMPKFMEFTKTWTLPFINVNNYNELKYHLEILLSNPEFMESEAKRARLWMETFWNKEKHIDNLNNILNKFGFKGEINV